MSVAQLCLKHRINKNQRQRIVVFVSSIVDASEEQLDKLAKKLRRNAVAVNLVNLCEETNKEKLQKVASRGSAVHINPQFVTSVNSENNSSIVNFESDNDMILNDFLSADGFFGEAYRNVNNGGQDDFMDEQLQMALRISLEEEKKRIEEMEKKKLDEQESEVGQNPFFWD